MFQIIKYAAPNKFYESLMLGKPVIMAKNTGFDEILETEKIGYLMDYSFRRFGAGIRVSVQSSRSVEWNERKVNYLYENDFSWEIMQQRIKRIFIIVN